MTLDASDVFITPHAQQQYRRRWNESDMFADEAIEMLRWKLEGATLVSYDSPSRQVWRDQTGRMTLITCEVGPHERLFLVTVYRTTGPRSDVDLRAYRRRASQIKQERDAFYATKPGAYQCGS